MNAPAAMAATILDAAERMTQAVGYNGLSFRDLAAAVGIKSSSVHYHFPTKGQLGAAVARRYTDRLIAHMHAVAAAAPTTALDAYVAVLRGVLQRDGAMCLCGMLAAEIDAIPPEVRTEVRRFVDANVSLIAAALARDDGAATDAAVRDHARALFAALEGAILVARGTGDIAAFDRIVDDYRRFGLLPG